MEQFLDTHPLISVGETKRLIAAAQDDDQKARNQLIEANLRLVMKIAYKFLWSGWEIEELIAEGMFGLINAIQKFDLSRNLALSTYATPHIHQSIKRALENTAYAARIPVHIHGNRSKALKAKEEFETLEGKAPTMAQVAQDSGLSEEEVDEALSISLTTKSLDAPVGEDEATTLGEIIAAPKSDPLEELFKDRELAEKTPKILDLLPYRERKMIEMSLGINASQMVNNKEIGDVFGVSDSRASTLRLSGIEILRQYLEGELSEEDVLARKADIETTVGKEEKTCSRCKNSKPVTEFPKRLRNGKVSYNSYCKLCKKELDAERWATEKDAWKAKTDTYRGEQRKIKHEQL